MTTSAKSPVPVRRDEAPPRQLKLSTRIILLTLIAAGIVTAAFLSRESPEPEPPRLRTLTSIIEPAVVPRGRMLTAIQRSSGDQRGALSSASVDAASSRTGPPSSGATQSVDTRPPAARSRMNATRLPCGDQSPSKALSISLRGSPPTTPTR